MLVLAKENRVFEGTFKKYSKQKFFKKKVFIGSKLVAK